jgi:threonine/homoserine/homoserine lactone efflux protein
LEPVEAHLAATAGVILIALAVLFAIFPHLLAYPLVFAFAWIGGALLYTGYKWRYRKPRRKRRGVPAPTETSESTELATPRDVEA